VLEGFVIVCVWATTAFVSAVPELTESHVDFSVVSFYASQDSAGVDVSADSAGRPFVFVFIEITSCVLSVALRQILASVWHVVVFAELSDCDVLVDQAVVEFLLLEPFATFVSHQLLWNGGGFVPDVDPFIASLL